MKSRDCPQCGGPLIEVTQEENSPFNHEQWHSMIAGDYYCEKCPDNGRAKNGKCYFWEHEVDGKPRYEGPGYCGRCGFWIQEGKKCCLHLSLDITDTQRLEFIIKHRLDVQRVHVLGQHYDWALLTFNKDPYGFVRPREVSRSDSLRGVIDAAILRLG